MTRGAQAFIYHPPVSQVSSCTGGVRGEGVGEEGEGLDASGEGDVVRVFWEGGLRNLVAGEEQRV